MSDTATKSDSISVPRSLMRGLFLGGLGDEFLYPFPEQDPEERENTDLALESFAQWADDNLDPVAIDRDQEIPESVKQGLAELGIMGFTVPEEYDGYGFSYTAYCRLMEEVCRRDGSLGTHIGGHLSIGSKAIDLFGTDEQKRRWLPKVASGESIACFALTEPGAGSDPAAMRTRAEWDEEKGHWVINGNKIWITNGGYADLFTVFALTPVTIGGKVQDKASAFILERGMPGFTNGPSEHKMGIRGSSTVELAFENVVVPAENLIGKPGRGLKAALEVLNTGRLSLAAGCIGGSKEVLRLALEHATQRQQFQTYVVDFEQLRRKFSAMAADIYAMESMVYLAAGLADRGEPDCSLESAACKIYCSESAWRLASDAMQIVGGIGYMTEYPYERFLRDIRINMIFEGTNEVLRMFVALAGLQKPSELLRRLAGALKSPLGSGATLARYAGRRLRRARPERPGWVAPALEAEGKSLAHLTSGMAGATEEVIRRHQKEVLQRGYVQERLADAAIGLYGVAAVLSRASTRVAKEGTEAAERDILLARAWCDGTLRGIRRNLAAIRRADDSIHDRVTEALKERGAYFSPLF
jgi:acyl-CoA dehydrogenase family protein 9